MPAPDILIAGAGSVGRRHARNLHSLGAQVSFFDPRSDRLAQAKEELPEAMGLFDQLETANAQGRPFSGAVIASPPRFHVDQAIAFLERGVPVLLEKPVSPDLDAALRLEAAVKRATVPLLLGYTYRWWPPLLELHRRLAGNAMGPVRHVRFMMSAHLADWHPWERYQDFFMASRELGGGALLDESHFIDLMLWLFGMPQAIQGRVERLSSLDIDTDDNVDLLAVYPNNLRVSIHLDLYGRPHEKMITVVGEAGTLQCRFDPNEVRFSSEAAGDWQVTPFACERNDMFLGVASEFLELLAGRGAPSCTIEDGVQVLRCVEALRQATEEGRSVPL
jgi:predicted dehydrogenase